MCTLAHLKAANMRRSITHGWWVLRLADTCVSDPTALSKIFLKRVIQLFLAVRGPTCSQRSNSWRICRTSSVFFVFVCILLLFVLFVSVYICKNFVFGFANRKVSWVEFPMIGKSGFVKGHSLTRRHKQYIPFFETMRVYASCHFCIHSHRYTKFLIIRISIMYSIFYKNVQL